MKPATALRIAVAALSVVVLLYSDGAAAFNCSSASKCHALAGYVTPNATTYAAIKSLFGVKSIKDLLGANNLSLSTKPTDAVSARTTVRVPFPCACANGNGASDGRPVYSVKANDTLDIIARNIFSEFVTYQQIAAASGIKNPDKINIGQKVNIPLPCSCDVVDGLDVVHYAHKVASGSSVSAIAAEFGTTEATLLRINGIADPKFLLANQILDVPLRACNSSISATSHDSSLRLTNGSYAITAKNCVQCSCSADTWLLTCEAVKGQNTTQDCRPATCAGASSGELPLGQTARTTCDTCAYAGYNDSAILTTLIRNQSACAAGGGTGQSPPSGGYALRPGLVPSSWWTAQLLLWFHVVLLCFAWL